MYMYKKPKDEGKNIVLINWFCYSLVKWYLCPVKKKSCLLFKDILIFFIAY
jgi:hypothetical protein